jgi:hypothetical protein
MVSVYYKDQEIDVYHINQANVIPSCTLEEFEKSVMPKYADYYWKYQRGVEF